MEVKIKVLVPIVVIFGLLFIAVIIIACYFFVWPYYRRRQNAKAQYAQLLNDGRIKRRALRKASIVGSLTSPSLHTLQTEQSSRIKELNDTLPYVGNKFIYDPVKLQNSRLNNNENNNENKSITDKTVSVFADRRSTIGEDEVFHFDGTTTSSSSSSLSSSFPDYKLSESDYFGSTQNLAAFDRDNNNRHHEHLSRDMKTRFRSEPALNTHWDNDEQNASSGYRKVRKKSTIQRISSTLPNKKKSRALSVMAPAGGQVEFTLYYNANDKLLTINLIQLIDINLRPECFVGILDIIDKDKKTRSKISSVHLIRQNDNTLQLCHYTETGFMLHLSLLPSRNYTRRTSMVFGNQSIVFNEKFTINENVLNGNWKDSFLCIHALCTFGKRGEPIVLGECRIPLKRLQSSQILPFMGNLKTPTEEIELESSLKPAADLGCLEIYLSFNPIAQSLVVKIIQANRLPKIGMTRSPNVSVKMTLYYCNLRVQKQTTSTQKRQRDPIFNETFEFQLSKDRISECDVLFEVRHHGPMYRSVIGYVIVGNSAGGEGTKQWRQLLDFTCHEKLYKITPRKPAGLN